MSPRQVASKPQSPDPLADEQLIERWRRGDDAAFELLLERYQKPVYNFCLRMLGQRALAEDALQDIFLKVVRAGKTWQANARFSTWLFTIARNDCIDHLRKA